jgi:hypothetical protein
MFGLYFVAHGFGFLQVRFARRSPPPESTYVYEPPATALPRSFSVRIRQLVL